MRMKRRRRAARTSNSDTHIYHRTWARDELAIIAPARCCLRAQRSLAAREDACNRAAPARLRTDADRDAAPLCCCSTLPLPLLLPPAAAAVASLHDADW